MPHNAAEARALLFNRKLQEKPVEFSIPGLEELDGELSVLELKASELKQCEKLSEGPDGETDNILMMAAVVCKSLVMRATKERLFSDTDMGTINYATGEGSGVAAFGLISLVRPRVLAWTCWPRLKKSCKQPNPPILKIPLPRTRGSRFRTYRR